MGWNTVDKSKSHEARGEDVERRELRLRRTYNEAASGHRLLAQNSAEAPPRAEIDALYWSVLEEVGTARSGKEEAWDGALRVACARHLSELREAGGDGAGAVEAACFAADAAPADAGLWLRLHRLAAGPAAGGERWPAYNRCRVAIEAARRVEELRGAFGAGAAAKVVARVPALVRRAYASLDVVAPPAPPRAPRAVSVAKPGLLGLGDAVLQAHEAAVDDARARRASLEAPLAFTIAYDEEQLSRSTSINPSLSRSASVNPSPSPSSLSRSVSRSPAPPPDEPPSTSPAPAPAGDKAPRRGTRRRKENVQPSPTPDDEPPPLPLAPRLWRHLAGGEPPAAPAAPAGVDGEWLGEAAAGGDAAPARPAADAKAPDLAGRSARASLLAVLRGLEAAKLPRSPELERIAGATARVLEDFYGEALPAEILVFVAELAWTGDASASAFDDRRARAAFGGEAVAELAARLHWLDAVVAQARGDGARAARSLLACGRVFEGLAAERALHVPHLGDEAEGTLVSAAAVAAERAALAETAASLDARKALARVAAVARSAHATGALAAPPPAPSPSGESPRPPEPPQIQDLWDAVLDDYVAEAGAADDVDLYDVVGVDALAGDAVRRALDGQGAGADVVSVLCGTCGDRYARCDLALQVALAAVGRLLAVGPSAAAAALCRDRTAPRAASRAAARRALGALAEALRAALFAATGGECVRALGAKVAATLAAATAAAARQRAPDALRALAAGAAKADALAGHAAASEAVDAALAGALLRGADLDRRRGRPDGDVLDEAGAVAAALAALHPARLAPATRTVALAGAVDVLRKLDGDGAVYNHEKCRTLRARAADAACALVEARETRDAAAAFGAEVHRHLAARRCCDGDQAVFLRGRVAWLARSAAAAPRGGRRPVDTRDTELFAAQCWYDFVGCRVLRDVANSRVDDKLRAKRLRLLGPSERHAFVRHVAPLVLRDKCGDEAPLPLAPRRDVLDALEAVARASQALEEQRSGDDDDVEAYLFAPTDEPRTFPAYLLGTAASANGDGASHAAPEDPADAGERLLAEMMVLKLTQRDKEAAQETKTPAALELSRLEALRWHLRCCALEPRRAAHWAAAARTLEDLAAPLLSLGRLAAPAGVGLRRCVCLSTRSLVAKPFGNDAELVATAREMPRGPWYRFPELGQDWIDAMAEAKAEARREAAKRCWVVAHGLANGSRGAYAAAVGCLCYEDARDASKLGNVTTAFRHATDAKAAFEAAASLGAPATRAFALMMAGKLAWRDAARPFDDRASAAIAAFAAAVDASPAAIAKHCGREDPDVVWRLHATRLKVAALADAGRASPTALAAAAATRFAPPSSAEDSGALLSVVDDCLAAFKACRKDDPYHARAIHYHGRALLLAAKLSSAGEPASAARDAFVEAAVGDARAALDALCDRKRPQVVALWRVEGVSGCQAGLDANHRKYDRSRFKHLALYVAVLADLRDHDRLRGVAGWIASSKERSRTTRAMLHTVWNAQLRALQTDLNAPRPPAPAPPAPAPPAPPSRPFGEEEDLRS